MKKCSSAICLLLLLLNFVSVSTGRAERAPEITDLSGSVIDENGKPISDAKVVLIYKSWPGGRYRQQSLSAKTNKEGKFTFEDLYKTGDKTAFLVTLVKGGYCLQSEYVFNGDGEKLKPFEFKLAIAKNLTGQLVDEYKMPLKNIVVFPAKRKTKAGEEFFYYFQSGSSIAKPTDANGKIDLSYYQATIQECPLM